jgi:hypothetical protein
MSPCGSRLAVMAFCMGSAGNVGPDHRDILLGQREGLLGSGFLYIYVYINV